MDVTETPKPSRLQPAVMFTAMMQRHLNVSRRKGGGVKVAYPDGENHTVEDTCFRGAGMPTEHLRFFEVIGGANHPRDTVNF